MTRARALAAVLTALALGLGTVAFASSLVVTSQDLTVSSSTVSVPKSVVTVSQAAVGGAPNTAHTTTVTLSGGTSSAVGSLTITLFPGGTCTGTPVSPGAQVISPIAGASGQSYTSAARTPVTAGTYSWLASYSGDANNEAASNCKSITVATSTQLHVEAITLVSRTLNTSNGKWSAVISVEVRDGNGLLIGTVVATGVWSPDAQGSSQSRCTTGAAGTCQVNSGSNSFPSTAASETWTVSSLTKSGYTYNAAANVVSSITVAKPS